MSVVSYRTIAYGCLKKHKGILHSVGKMPYLGLLRSQKRLEVYSSSISRYHHSIRTQSTYSCKPLMPAQLGKLKWTQSSVGSSESVRPRHPKIAWRSARLFSRESESLPHCCWRGYWRKLTFPSPFPCHSTSGATLATVLVASLWACWEPDFSRGSCEDSTAIPCIQEFEIL